MEKQAADIAKASSSFRVVEVEEEIEMSFANSGAQGRSGAKLKFD